MLEAYTNQFKLGVGTGGLDRQSTYDVVSAALDIGYRHIDTAESYDNERAVGQAVADSEVMRDEVLIATKLHSENLHFDDVLAHARACRRRLGVDTIDLLYVHWPAHSYHPEETFRAFAELRDRGHIDHVGVCNFTADLLLEARDAADCPIAVMQAEIHPIFKQDELVESVRNHGSWLLAHTPLAQGSALELPEISTIAERRGITRAQVCLAWLLSKSNVGAVPGASVPHLRENFEALDVTLREEDIQLIESLPTETRLVNYEFAPWHREF